VGLLELLAEVEARGDAHIVELATPLLRLCRSDSARLRSARLDPRCRAAFQGLRGAVQSVVRDRGRLVQDELREIGRLARARLAIPEVLIASAIAEGIDAGAGQLFATWFRGKTLDLRPGDPFPVAAFPLRSWVHASTGDPRIRTEPLDRLPHLRLAPEDLRGLRISMQWVDARLAEIEHAERFGVGVLGEADVFGSYEWDRYSIDDERLFFHVRPRDEVDHLRRVRHVLDIARQRRIDLLVLPELSLTDSMHRELAEANAFEHPRYVVAGSWHVPRGRGPGQNESALYARGRVLGRHRKFRPVVLRDRRDDHEQPRDVARLEHLEVHESRIHVLLSGDWSVATLICKDVMDNGVQDLLRDLAIQFVLVPAMSPKVDDFLDLAQQLGRDPQGYTLIANTGEVCAIVGTPCSTSRVNPYSCTGPEVLVFNREGRLIKD